MLDASIYIRRKKDFTSTEKQISKYILKNLNNIGYLSAEKLGKLSYTSKASVIRFCKKIGLSGYQEFKTKLLIEIYERSKENIISNNKSINNETPLKEVFNIVPDLYKNSISNINSNLHESTLRRIISNIEKSSTIDIYGMGITYTCATTAKFKLRTLGYNCNTYSGINEHYIMASKSHKNKVAIILSFTGNNSKMIETAKYLKYNDKNTRIIGIGGKESKNLLNYCNDYIEVFSKELLMGMEVLPLYLSITYIFDLIFSALLISNFDKNLEIAVDVLNFKNSDLL